MEKKNTKPKSVQLEYRPKDLDWHNFVTLPQMRSEFASERIRELANDIAVNGIVNPQIVALFSEKSFWDYVQYVCQIYQQPLSAREKREIAKKKQPGGYQVIVAGECRLRAFHLLWNEGCDACQKENHGKKVSGGACWRRHLVKTEVTVRVPQTKDPAVLISTQLAENVHHRPSPIEEAESIAKFTVFLKSQGDISYADIAKRIGRSPDMVSRYLSFYELPKSIRTLVREKTIPYGMAVELARLHHKLKFSEADLLREANVAVSHREYHQVKAFSKYVSGIIIQKERDRVSRIQSLDMIFEQVTPEKRMKGALNQQTVLLARTLMIYLDKMPKLWEHPANAPFVKGKKLTVGGMLADYMKIISTMEDMIPYVEDAVTVEEACAIRDGIIRLKKIIKRKVAHSKGA